MRGQSGQRTRRGRGGLQVTRIPFLGFGQRAFGRKKHAPPRRYTWASAGAVRSGNVVVLICVSADGIADAAGSVAPVGEAEAVLGAEVDAAGVAAVLEADAAVSGAAVRTGGGGGFRTHSGGSQVPELLHAGAIATVAMSGASQRPTVRVVDMR